MSEPGFANGLIGETSPYLLQHAHNPVQWHPWGAEALLRAKAEDKPILLSIGYSACHWCHVMAHESFENERIAGLMNELFINIKVDREERPDLDGIYMEAVQLITGGGGGWPMTVFLTPDLNPFFAGTYFPPEERHGMPGFPDVLQAVARAYREKRTTILDDADRIAGEMRKLGQYGTDRGKINADLLNTAVSDILSSHDRQYGGFGRAPKFPPAMALTLLMKSYRRTRERDLLAVVEHTLHCMAEGGIYDQLGGGFHRYSVDQSWLTPHFEKMLYDNALLSRAYLDAFLLTGNPFYRRIAEETLDYVVREMSSPEGGFYSAQDADSAGSEGAFYIWTPGEVEEISGKEDAKLLCGYYDITPQGNFVGRNILHVPHDSAAIVRSHGISEDRMNQVVSRGKHLLYQSREHRIKPGRDEKILTAWNGLMLRSFAEAAGALGRKDYCRIAVRNAEFLMANLYREGRLLRSFKDGRAKLNAYLEDYAFTADALLSLYEASFDERWIGEALNLGELMVDKFRDRRGGGFFFTSEDHEALIHRKKEFMDNAIPSGNSVAASMMLRLWKFTGDAKWSDMALAIMEEPVDSMARYPSAFAHLLSAVDFYISGAKEIAVVGDPQAEDTIKMLDVLFQRYLPNKVVACGRGDNPSLLKSRQQLHGRTMAYVCENFKCSLPLASPEELSAELEKRENSSPIHP
jgi:uncharacterized protein